MVKLIFNSCQKLFYIAVIVLLPVSAHCQVKEVMVKQYLETELKKDTTLVLTQYVNQFYASFGYKFAWVNNDSALHQLLAYIDHADENGLNREDYHIRFITSYLNKTEQSYGTLDSLVADITFTDCAMQFFRDIVFGKEPPYLKYNGLDYTPDCINLPERVSASLAGNTFNHLLAEVENHSPEYIALKKQALAFIMPDSLTVNLTLIFPNLNADNKPLLQKLYQLGIISSIDTNAADKETKNYLKQAQRLFYLPETGILNDALIKELNTPVSERKASLYAAMNTFRWLNCIRQKWQHIVVVNIPSANLLVYEGNNVTLESKLIVGKYSTQTPTLCSMIKEVILYPYWNVPSKIAVRELLPLIKRNSKYLNDNNFQVLNKQGRLIDPSSINWLQLSANYFPYILRQSTGCDNSLGIVKLNFYSPFDVYLHDTPWKILFNLNTRYFSHGCMRLQKAVEMAHLLLKDNSIAIDTLISKGCLNNQHPITVPATEKMPVFVLYHTAWVDSSSTVRFYDDVYNRKRPARK